MSTHGFTYMLLMFFSSPTSGLATAHGSWRKLTEVLKIDTINRNNMCNSSTYLNITYILQNQTVRSDFWDIVNFILALGRNEPGAVLPVHAMPCHAMPFHPVPPMPYDQKLPCHVIPTMHRARPMPCSSHAMR